MYEERFEVNSFFLLLVFPSAWGKDFSLPCLSTKFFTVRENCLEKLVAVGGEILGDADTGFNVICEF